MAERGPVQPLTVFATSAGDDPDNLTAVLMYPDGSRVTISYLTEGNSRFPKERIVAFGGGRVARLDNFKRVELWEGRKTKVKRSRGGVDKGQSDEMRAFVAGAKSGVMPIDIETIIATTRTTHHLHFRAERLASPQALENQHVPRVHVDGPIQTDGSTGPVRLEQLGLEALDLVERLERALFPGNALGRCPAREGLQRDDAVGHAARREHAGRVPREESLAGQRRSGHPQHGRRLPAKGGA